MYKVIVGDKHIGETNMENKFIFLSNAVMEGKIGPSFDFTTVKFEPIKPKVDDSKKAVNKI